MALAGGIFLLFFSAPLLIVSHFNEAGKLLSSHYILPKFYLILCSSLFLLALYCLKLAVDTHWRQNAAVILGRSLGVRLLAALLGLMLLSTSAALVKPAVLLALGNYLVLGWLWFLLRHCFHYERFRNAALSGLQFAGGGAVIIGFLQYFKITEALFIPIRGTLGGSFATNTVFSHFLIITYPFVLVGLWQNGTKLLCTFSRKRALLLAGQLLLVVGLPAILLMAGSRSGILVGFLELAAVLVMVLWLTGKRLRSQSGPKANPSPPKYKYYVISLIFILLLAIAAGTYLFTSGISDNPKISSSVRVTNRRLRRARNYIKKIAAEGVSLKNIFGGRYSTWCNTTYMIREHPLLGVGLNNWQFQYPYYHRRCPNAGKSFNYRKRMYRAHNEYLQMTAECGIPAGLLFLFIWFRQLYLLIRVRSNTVNDRHLRFALAISWAAFSLVMMISFPLQRPFGRLFFFFLLALNEARTRLIPETPVLRDSSPN
jgi:O-antigen ligase